MQIERDARVFVAGHRGLVGSALLRKLDDDGFTNILTASRHELELRDQAEVSHWFKANRPGWSSTPGLDSGIRSTPTTGSSPSKPPTASSEL